MCTVFSYFALVDEEKSPGVSKKINHTVLAAANIGLKSDAQIFTTDIHGAINFLSCLVRTKSDIVMIRFSDLVFPAVFFVMLILRIKGCKILIDVPTPRITGLRELDSAVKSNLTKVLRKFWSIVSGSWVLIPANLIIQYAEEGTWFSLGVKGKTLKIGNGILINKDLPLTKARWPGSELKLIAVAQLSKWHGYDRLINALAELKGMHLPYSISLTVVGDGDELSYLKDIVSVRSLENEVFFTGMLLGEELNDAFSEAHIGVASLGLFRIGLQEASVLKAREYLVRGLPIIGAGSDPDFDDSLGFRYEVENNESLDGLIKLLSSFATKNLIAPSEARSFAERRLSLESKLSSIIEAL